MLRHLTLAPLLLAACTPTSSNPESQGGAPCVPNQVVECACVGGETGIQTCQPDGRYGACACAEQPPGGDHQPGTGGAPSEPPAGGSPPPPVGGEDPVEPPPAECDEGAEDQEACGQDGTRFRICAGGRWSEWGECAEAGPCVDEESDVQVCGVNGRGLRARTCRNGEWPAFGQCIDHDVCPDDTSGGELCGLNGSGTRSRRCEVGQWTEWTACEDPDVCLEGTSEDGQCGDGGAHSRQCRLGQWSAWSECSDERVCEPGEEDTQPCGELGLGAQVRRCSDGWWGAWGECAYPDPCERDPALRVEAPGTYPIDLRQTRAVHGTRCEPGVDGGEARVEIVLTHDSIVTARTTRSNFDPVLFLRSECARQGSEVDCNDDNGTRESALRVTLAAGTYHLFVGGYGDARGRTQLEVEIECADPVRAGARCERCNARFAGADCDRCAAGFAGPTCNPALSSIAIGHGYGCGLTAEGEAWCWGRNFDGQAEPPPGPFTQISAGDSHLCALTPQRRVVCWGDDDEGQASPPPGEFLHVEASRIHTCGLAVDGTIQCWGSDVEDASAAPDGTFVELAGANTSHTCARPAEGRIRCWGFLRRGQGSAPHFPVSGMAVGNYHVCALREAEGTPEHHTVHCWGAGGMYNNQQAVPPPGVFRSLSSGLHNTCGVNAAGQVECWGSDHEGQISDIPDGVFTQVSVGFVGVCGLRAQGGVECWGDMPNDVGEGPEVD
jgi:hypothetical protein